MVDKARYPVIIIGSGPIGLRCAQELLTADEDVKVEIFSGEQWRPYNRVRLSGFLGGEYEYEEIELPVLEKFGDRFTFNSGQLVTHIHREQQSIETQDGKCHPYSSLVLATGSRAHIPSIPGVVMKGVYTFRDIDDAFALQARKASARHVVVIGGGLLGLEAAKAMRVYNTQVTIIEHSHHLMYEQLDARAGHYLEEYISSLNINVLTQNRAKTIEGDTRVEQVTLADGTTLECDTVIIAAGIRPNLELAKQAGLAFGRGITVNNYLQTNDESIYAIGDCAEHDKIVYGLVAPGYEQASVAAARILNRDAQYLGSSKSTSLKVAGCPVFSMGDVSAMRDSVGGITYENGEKNTYRRIHVERGHIKGALSIGEWKGKARLQEAITHSRLVWPWQRFRFRKSGDIWPGAEDKSVSAWPGSAVVCQCTGITRGQLSAAIESGCENTQHLAECTGASTVCGTCKPLLNELLGSEEKLQPVFAWRWLWGAGLFTLLLGFAYLLLPGSGFQSSVMTPSWDFIWRDSLMRQISGFTLLGVGALISIVSLRKRARKFQWGSYDIWRLGHVLLGTFLALLLWVHTGARLGENLNLMLMLSFTGMLIAGAVLGAIIGNEFRLSSERAQILRKASLWVHLILLWPLPVLLSFHILKAYYF